MSEKEKELISLNRNADDGACILILDGVAFHLTEEEYQITKAYLETLKPSNHAENN